MDAFTIPDVEAEFRKRLQERGIIPPGELIADGKLHRCDVDAKHGKKDATYLLFMDGIPAGGFENFRDGAGWENWCFRKASDMSPAEFALHQARVEEAKKERERQEIADRAEAAEKAAKLWTAGKKVVDHPYFKRKGVEPSDTLREVPEATVEEILDYHPSAKGEPLEGRIVVAPVKVGAELSTCEMIDENGRKVGIRGGRKGGGYWAAQPLPEGNGDGFAVLLGEGVATCLSAKACSGLPVVAALTCNNLEAVGAMLRGRYPRARIVLLADIGVGEKKAHEAAARCGGSVAVPEVDGMKPESGTDFNDLHALAGAAAVKACIDKALANDSGPLHARDLFPMAMQEIIDRKEGKKRIAVNTGIRKFDKLTGGLRMSELSIVGGLPGSGKTAAAIGIICHNARHGIPCLLFSLEMNRIAIAIRAIAQESVMSAADLFDEDVKIDRETWSRVIEANGRLEKFSLTVDDRLLNLDQIDDAVGFWREENVRGKDKRALVVIDYLGLIRSKSKSENRNREIAAMAQGGKAMAKRHGLHVSFLAQMNRAGAKRDGDPSRSDLRDSGEIEEAADMIILPHPAARNDEGEIIQKPNADKAFDKWICDKNRNGRTGAVPVIWHRETMLYTDVEICETRTEHWNERGETTV